MKKGFFLPLLLLAAAAQAADDDARRFSTRSVLQRWHSAIFIRYMRMLRR